MIYWSALDILKQTMSELGLVVPAALPTTDVQTSQMLALLNSAGNELVLLHVWEHLLKQWQFVTVNGQAEYPLPDDLAYIVDQTQWDKTNRLPLAGPKSPQEWSWLEAGLTASGPRLRYRIINNKLKVMPVPGATPTTVYLEYISNRWAGTGDMVSLGTEPVKFNPWLVIKFLKQKFYELRGFDSTNVAREFTRMFMSVTGQDVGAPVLSLAGNAQPVFIGGHSVPDGNWSV